MCYPRDGQKNAPNLVPAPVLDANDRAKLRRFLDELDVPDCHCKEAEPHCQRWCDDWPHCSAVQESKCTCCKWPHCDGQDLYYEPCPCVRALPDVLPHGIRYDQWADLLYMLRPDAPKPGKLSPEADGYGELPPPQPCGARELETTDRVDLMRLRFEAGTELFHAKDGFTLLESRVAVMAGKGRVQQGLRGEDA
jgi:hypothetical protein